MKLHMSLKQLEFELTDRKLKRKYSSVCHHYAVILSSTLIGLPNIFDQADRVVPEDVTYVPF